MAGINDFQAGNWWTTVSGFQSDDPTALDSWADDYTRSRRGIEATYSGTDTLYGRKPIADVNP